MKESKIEELSEKDLFELMILYICRNKKSWKIIDSLYSKNYDECIEISDDAKEKFNSIIRERECIETKCYIQRIAALMALDERNNVKNIGEDSFLFEIVKSVYNKIYKYTVSVDKIRISRYWSKHLKDNSDATQTCAEVTALLFIARVLNKEVDKEDIAYEGMLRIFPNINKERDKSSGYPGCLYEAADKELKVLVNKIEARIRANKFLKYNFDSMLVFKSNYDPSETDVYERLAFTSTMAFMLDDANVGALLNGLEVNRNTIKDIITIYLEMTSRIYEDRTITLEDVDMDQLISFMYIYIIQSLFVKLYNRTDKFFFDNYNENTISMQKRLIEESRNIKKKNLLLVDKIDSLKNEIESLKRQVNKYEKELIQAKSNDKELFELRSYIFNNQEKGSEELAISEEYCLDFLEDKKVVCFGGTNSWISNISDELDWIFIPAENINFDANIIKDADVIVIKATCISHGMYYKIMANASKEAQIKFINGTNINKVKYELSAYSN